MKNVYLKFNFEVNRILLSSILICLTFCFANFQGTAQTFNQISTVAEITNGNYLLVGDDLTNDGLMLNTSSGTPFINATSVTNPGTSIVNPSASNIFEITVSGGQYTIYNTSAGYVSWGRSGNIGNTATFYNSTIDNNERWTVSASSGLFAFSNVSTPARILQWNNSSPRFACYTSAQVHLKLYKQSSPSTYSVTYNGNGNTGGSVPTDGNSYSSGATVTVLGNTGSLTQDCGTFTGWNTAADGSGTGYAPAATFSITANTTLYAQWTSSATTVTFNGNGATGGSMANQSACTNTALTTNAFTRTGYTFTNWHTTASGTGGTTYTDGQSYNFSANMDLYAQWSINNYTVTFNGNSSTSGAPALPSVSGNYNTSVTLSGIGTLARTGYTFNGWNTLANGTGTDYAAGGPYTIGASDIILYAKWVPNNYDVIFDANNGSGTMANQTIAYNTTAALSNNTFTRSGYTFNGWNTAADGSGTGYANGANYTMNTTSNVTLFAQWIVYTGPWEDFESGSNITSYGGTGTFTAGSWILTEALATNGDANDKKNGARSVRLRNSTSILAMNFDITTGLSSVTLSHGMYGSDASGTWRLEVSNDGGSTWTAFVSATYTATSSGLASQTISGINLSGNVRFRIVKLSTNNNSNRLNIDDIYISPFSSTPAPEINIVQGSTNLASGTGEYDFGNQEVSTTTSAVSFTIENTGNANLILDGSPNKIAISGTNSSDFTINQTSTTSPVSGLGTTTFTVTFTPGALGARSAIISIDNNDATGGEDPYTFTVKGSGTNSALSSVVDNTNYSSGTPEFNIDPEYINFIDGSATTTGKFIPMKLRIIDGPDTDDKNTTLTAIRFTVTDLSSSNRLAMIKTAILTNTAGTYIATASKIGNELVFTGMTGANVTAFDTDGGGSGDKIIHLRVSIDETQVIDKTKLIFTVTSVTADAAGSVFALSNGGGAQSDNSSMGVTLARNRLNVTATKLLFSTISDGSVNNPISAFTVSATDLYNRVDIDVNGTLTIDCPDDVPNGSFSISGGPYNLTNGISSSIGGVQFNAVQSNIHLTASNITPLLTGTSNAFNIVLVSYAYNAYLSTTGSGNYTDPDVWCRCQNLSGCTGTTPGSGGWNNLIDDANTPGASSTVFIQGAISLGTALGVTNSTILSGGNLIVNNQHAVSNSMTVKANGTVTNNDRFNFGNTSATFTIEDGGNLILNSYQDNPNNSLWNGVEVFSANSNVYINYGYRNAPLFTPATIISSNPVTSAKFGNLILQPISFNEAGHWNGIFPTGTYQLAKGNFTVNNSSDRNLTFFNGTHDVTIGGNMYIDVAVAAQGDVVTTSASGTTSLTVNGNVEKTGAGIFRLNGSGNGTLNIDGNLTISGVGYFRFGGFLPNTISNLNLKGNLLIGTDAILEAGHGPSFANNRFNFTGSGNIQTIDVKASVGNKNQFISFFVKNNAYAQLIQQNLSLGSNSNFNVEAGGTLDFGYNGSTALIITQTSSASPAPTFSMTGNAKIIITHPNGIDRWQDATDRAIDGNLQVTGTRSYSMTGIYHYKGISPQQRLGDGILFGGISGKSVIVELDALSTNLILEGNAGTSSTSFSELTDIGLSNAGSGLKIIQGTVVGTATSDFMSTGNLEMTGGWYRIAYPHGASDVVPRLSGTYSLTGGTIELYGTAAQKLRGGISPNTPHYFNLRMSGSNTVTINNTPLVISNDLDIRNTAIFDIEDNNVSGTATLTMTDTDPGEGGRFKTASINPSATQPALTGAYNLTAGVIEFNNSQATRQSIRTSGTDFRYKNIEVTGNNVGHSTGNIAIKDNGNFSILNNGVYYSSSNAIESVNATPVNTRFTMLSGSTVMCNNVIGFNSPPIGTDNATVKSGTNGIATIDLQSNSTINYSRNNPEFTDANQSITNTLPYQNLTISGTGDKNAPPNGSGELQILGHLSKSNTSSFLHNSGTVNFIGLSQQNFSNTSAREMLFFNVINNNTHTNGLTINSDSFAVARKLTLINNSKLRLNTGNIILKSDASGTASMDLIPEDNSNIIQYASGGRFIVERYLEHTGNWNLLTSPINEVSPDIPTSVFNSWQESGSPTTISNGYGTQVTGPSTPAPTGFDGTSPAYSLKWWDPVINNFVGVYNTQTEPVNKSTGFYLFARGDRSYGFGSTTRNETVLRSKGKLYIGNNSASAGLLAPTVSRPASVAPFFSVANPFACTIDFQKVFENTGTDNIKDAFHLWDPNNEGLYNVGHYQAFVGAALWEPTPTPTPGIGLYSGFTSYSEIQSGQAFYVEADNINSAASVSFNETNKLPDVSRTMTREAQTPAELIMMSTMLHNSNNNITDGNRVVFDNEFQNGIGSEDAGKIMNSGENFGIKVASKNLIVEGRKPLIESDTIFYHMSNLATQNYRLSFEPRNLSSTGLIAELIDKYLNTRTAISLSDSTYYNFAATNVAASKAADRFMLVFRAPGGTVPVTFVSIAAQRQQDRSIKINWEVANELNIEQYEVQRSADGINFSGILSNDATNSRHYTKNDLSPLAQDNFYRIKAIGIAGDITYSQVVKLAPEKQPMLIVVQPNPVKDKQLNIRFSNAEAGDYHLQFTNSLGQVVFNGRVSIGTNAQLHKINLPTAIAAGLYQLIIREDNGKAVFSESIVIE